MRQHMKRKHKIEYNAESQAAGSERKKHSWTELEILRMATSEVNFDSNIGLLDHLCSIMNRSKDSIKGRRKNPQYKKLVDELKTTRTNNLNQSPAESNNNSNIVQDFSSSETDTMISYLRNLTNIDAPGPNNDDDDIEIITQITNEDDFEVKTRNFDAWLKKWTLPLTRKLRNMQNQPSLQSKKPLSNRKKRRATYRLHQRLFNSNTKKLASVLFDDLSLENSICPADDDVLTEYKSVFSNPSPADDAPIKDKKNIVSYFYPISKDEIKFTIKKANSNSAGPDGIKLSDIKTTTMLKLEILFNGMLLLGHTPSIISNSRTILIPKGKTDLNLVKNWRPITISSILLRLFNKILVKRFSIINLDQMQRGFTDIDGCLANNISLHTFIKNKRDRTSPYSIISLDLKKAFDSVSHCTIKRALQRHGFDDITIKCIMSAFLNVSTTVIVQGRKIGDVIIERGVKQGDPLSPFLFNCVMDEVLTLMNSIKGVQCLAYADDLVIICDDVKDGQAALDICSDILKERHLLINPSKCHAISTGLVPKKKKLFTHTVTQFKIYESEIPQESTNSFFKYLGIQIGDEGILCPSTDTLNIDLLNLRKAALKPFQKLKILNTFLIPRYISRLQAISINKKILKDVDKKIRYFIRKTLHLFQHSSNAIFYAPLKTGGLGIFNFGLQIPIIMKRRLETIGTKSQLLENVIHNANKTILHFDKIISTCTDSSQKIKEKFAAELDSGYSGNGILQVKNSKASYSFFINPPKYWSGEDYIKAINLRYNLLPSKSMPSVPTEERKCRAGCYANETLCHILQKCPITHSTRIARHDHVVKRIVDHAKIHSWTVLYEPYIRMSDGSLKKPDLIILKDDFIIVCDVGVHWEGPQNLNHSYHQKVAAYSSECFINKLKETFPQKDIFIAPLIVGARGIWCGLNKTVVSKLLFPESLIHNILNTAIKGSLISYKKFMKSCWEH